jgi:hypothetical protein
VRYTGKALNSVVGMKVVKGGLELTFSDPLDPKSVEADAFSASWWNYLWCSEYGSDDYSAADPDFFKKLKEYNELRENAGKNRERIAEIAKSFRKGKDKVTITGAKLSADARTVTLSTPDIKPVMQTNVKYRIKSADGTVISQEIHGTINRVPQ